MKEIEFKPIYKGPKKNHASVFIGQKDKEDDYEWNRIRIFHSQEVNTSYSGMKKFDKRVGLKTVFLGYVKDCE